ncbi:MAG: orange carotenoid protein N-terminal domain-containing protein, partial [Nodosilinea sp.]
MAAEKPTTQITEEPTDDLFQRYDALSVDDKLALLYYIYEAMGSSVTPAAPEAADPELAKPLVEGLFGLSKDDQLEVMRQVVRRDKSEVSEQYGGLSANNQLLVWFGWAEA